MALEDGDFGVVERGEWSYTEAVGVGPLRFGMAVNEVVMAAELLGSAKISDCHRQHAVFSQTWKVDIHRRGASSTPAVTAYVSQDAGLFGVACDAVQGPQVAYNGLLLVGREMGELESVDHAVADHRKPTSSTNLGGLWSGTGSRLPFVACDLT
ncbi:hypothetical protein ACFWG0_36450 [Streptomyces yangpuensis]|uniref:hypothetical protein n=1 Tax=Streptomyces yangpuensis TaxID=1648182 RepID=UPI00365EACB8